jgi:hypothetical protein
VLLGCQLSLRGAAICNSSKRAYCGSSFLLQADTGRKTKGYEGKDRVKENRQGCLSRSIKDGLQNFLKALQA